MIKPKTIDDLTQVKKKKKQKSISYSQYSMYAQCPRRWKLNYVDNLRKFNQSIHTLFGSAFHETLQGYLTVMYEGSVKEADSLKLGEILKGAMAKEYRKAMAMGQESGFTNKTEMREFLLDGVAILEYFLKKRGVYFSKKNTKLIGIETKLSLPLESNKNILFNGFIDIVMQDTNTGRYKIYDIKTSTMGWNKWMKADKNKTDQLLLYKQFYSKQFNHPMDRIEVEYFIVKRKLYENLDFPQKRVQKFTPANGTPSINQVTKRLSEFMTECFTSDGEYNTEHIYRKEASKKKTQRLKKENIELLIVGPTPNLKYLESLKSLLLTVSAISNLSNFLIAGSDKLNLIAGSTTSFSAVLVISAAGLSSLRITLGVMSLNKPKLTALTKPSFLVPFKPDLLPVIGLTAGTLKNFSSCSTVGFFLGYIDGPVFSFST